MEVFRVRKSDYPCDGCGIAGAETMIEISDSDGYTTLFCDDCALQLFRGLAKVMPPALDETQTLQ
jgi:hypothetical protein